MKVHGPPAHNSGGTHRVVVIGLDAADPDLVQLWCREGRLPFLRSFMQSGAWVRVISSRMFPNSPWPSFSTGVSPGKHGLYSSLQLRRGTTEIVQADPRACPYPPFWQSLRGSGKRVAIFDVPKAYLLAGIEGVQIVAWGEEYPLLNQSSFPPSLVKELTARFGRYRHPVEIPGRNSIARGLRIYDTLRRDLERKSRAARFLFAQADWDLFMVVFAEAHYGGHQFYHHFAADHWDYDPHRAVRLGYALPTLYAELDAALAGLLEGVSDDTTVCIVSVHGIATNYSGNHLMPMMLQKLGFQVAAIDPSDTVGSSVGGKWSRRLRELIPSRARAFVNEHLLPQSFHRKMHARQFRRSIDWRKTTAFFLPSDHFQGFISVNLQGREPWGIIEPGAEYEEVCGQLADELKRLINPQTGKCAVRDVVQVSKIYTGESVYDLPDVVVMWAEDGPIDQLYHPRCGLVANPGFQLRRTQHSAEGFLIAKGKYIKRGVTLSGVSVMDLAPSILYLLGQRIPRGLEGRVLVDFIDEQFLQAKPVEYEEKGEEKGGQQP